MIFLVAAETGAASTAVTTIRSRAERNGIRQLGDSQCFRFFLRS
jgi:hypothetical protein